MKKQSKAGPKKVASNPLSASHRVDSSIIQALLDLRQPWNPVLRAAIDLLRDDKGLRSTVVDYAYSERVYGNGEWLGEQITPPFRVGSIGIVLQGRVEVVLEEPISVKGRSTCSPVRPRPYAVLRPGNVIGSFEYLDRLCGVSTRYSYTLLAGPASVQVVHPAFSAFEYTEVIRKALKAHLEQRPDPSKHLPFFEQWKQSGESYNLIRSFANLQELDASHAKVLLILLNLVPGSIAEKRLHNTVVEAGWIQSALARRSLFPTSTRARINLSKKSVAGVADSVHAFVRRAEAVLRHGGLAWARIGETKEHFPALASFIDALSGERASKEIAVGEQHICVAAPLSSCLQHGLLSIVDDVLEAECKEGAIGKSFADDLLERWRAGAEPGQGGSALQEITHVLETYYTQESRKTGKDSTITVRNLEQSDWWTNHKNERSMPRNVPPFERLLLRVEAGFPKLRVLSLVDAKLSANSTNWNDTLIVSCQHLLTETGCWFQHLLAGESKPAIIVSGKHYSTSPMVAERLRNIGVYVVEEPEWKWNIGEYQGTMDEKAKLVWQTVSQQLTQLTAISKILVIDDGGFLISSIPSALIKRYRIVSVEQTQSGIEKVKTCNKRAKLPLVINVAESRLKRGVESLMVADAVLEKAVHFCEPLRSSKTKFGVIGLGCVGSAMFGLLEKHGLEVCWFDREQNKSTKHFKPLLRLLQESDVIFGCSGTDVIPAKDIEACAGKAFISCSSTDVEFRSLLRDPRARREIEHDPFATVLIDINGKQVRILNGGFPANFDRNPESVPLNQIQLTRALMHGGLLEAVAAVNNSVSSGARLFQDLTIETQRMVAMALLDVDFPTNLHPPLKDFVADRS